MEMKKNRCRVCLQNSTETFSIDAHVDAGISYLRIILTYSKLKFQGSINIPQHICMPCANLAKAAYNFRTLCEGPGLELECNQEIFKQDKTEDVNFTFTSNRCKTEDEPISNYTDYSDSYLSPTEDNDTELLNQTMEAPVGANAKKPLDIELANTNSSSNCFVVSLKEMTNILTENELETNFKDKNYIVEEALEIYHCTHCDKTFNRRRPFRNHIRLVHKLEKPPCYYCEYVPESKRDYEKHAEAEHADKKRIRCKYCNKTFFEFATLRSHLLIHSDSNKNVCKVCGSKFAYKYKLEKHLRTHEQKGSLKCPGCSHMASKECENECYLPQSPNESKNHIAQKHANKKSLTCTDCGKQFSELQIPKAHLLSHKTIKNRMCNVCGHKFKSNYKVKEHMRKHTGETPFNCSKCGRKFKHSHSLKRHIMKFHECDTFSVSVCKT